MSETPFDLYREQYERWFKENDVVFAAELSALHTLVPSGKKGVEIGVGTGLFAERLNVRYGIDPSENMLEYAEKRGIEVVKGVAEQLPYSDDSFDFALFVTSLCFIANPRKALEEAFRITRNPGEVIVAFLNRESAVGKQLEHKRNSSLFYQDAHFFSVEEIENMLQSVGFVVVDAVQTLNGHGEAGYSVQQGARDGGFIVLKALKQIKKTEESGDV